MRRISKVEQRVELNIAVAENFCETLIYLFIKNFNLKGKR